MPSQKLRTFGLAKEEAVRVSAVLATEDREQQREEHHNHTETNVGKH